ncbi:hypothetical protein [Bombilactobacillus bombi]|uniref:hypothetical protein n=1 Tax=Bombilactobacillus bombi TaxID=1303590 RepID=UPI001968E396|nr:hypothetical protein [Bombilactobacillus bombi]
MLFIFIISNPISNNNLRHTNQNSVSNSKKVINSPYSKSQKKENKKRESIQVSKNQSSILNNQNSKGTNPNNSTNNNNQTNKDKQNSSQTIKAIDTNYILTEVMAKQLLENDIPYFIFKNTDKISYWHSSPETAPNNHTFNFSTQNQDDEAWYFGSVTDNGNKTANITVNFSNYSSGPHTPYLTKTVSIPDN